MTPTAPTLNVDHDATRIVERSVQRLPNLATLPKTALEIERLEKDPATTAADFQQIIARDPALSVCVLKVTNSSFYGMSRQIGSIQHAVVRVGFSAVKNIAIAASVHKLSRADQIGTHFDQNDFWNHSVAVAAGTRELAGKTGCCSPEEAFLAGVIHDIGIIVAMQTCRPQFVEMTKTFDEDQSLTFRQAENRILGATHEAFGAGLCRKWKFPVQLENVAGYHHRPMKLPATDRTLPAIVHVADIMAARIGAGHTRTVGTEAIDPEVLAFLNLGESDLNSVAMAMCDATDTISCGTVTSTGAPCR